MLLDILAVCVVTLFSSLFICSTSVHGFPTSPVTLQYIHNNHPSPDLSSSLRLLSHHPVPSVDYDLGGDISEMLVTDSNEFSSNDDDDQALSSSYAASLDAFNEPFYLNFHSSPSQSLSRKLLLLLEKQRQQKEETEEEQQQQQPQQKRASPPSISTSSSSAFSPPDPSTQFSLHSAAVAAAFANPAHADDVANFGPLSESTRLSPSLQALVETNPFARAWLTLLLQKVMEEQPVPYIFKYGRRRKK